MKLKALHLQNHFKQYPDTDSSIQSETNCQDHVLQTFPDE